MATVPPFFVGPKHDVPASRLKHFLVETKIKQVENEHEQQKETKTILHQCFNSSEHVSWFLIFKRVTTSFKKNSAHLRHLL